jgi:WD40 repeat protein
VRSRISRLVSSSNPIEIVDPVAHFTADGHNLLTVDSRGARLWSELTGELRSSVEPRNLLTHGIAIGGFTAAAITSRGELITAGSEPVIDFWDLNTAEHLRSIEDRIKPSIVTLDLSLNEKQLLLTTFDGAVQTFSLTDPKLITELPIKLDETPLSLSPSGQTTLASYSDRLELWNNENGTMFKRLLPKGSTFSTAGVFDPISSTIAVGSNDGSVIFWNPDTGKATRLKELHSKAVSSILFSPDGDKVITAGADGLVTVISGDDHNQVRHLEEVDCPLSHLAIPKDMRRIIALCGTNSVAIWQNETGSLLSIIELTDQRSPINILELNQDGSRIVAANSKEVRIYWFNFGNAPESIEHGDFIAAAIDQTHNQLLALDSDAVLVRRDLNTQRLLAAQPLHASLHLRSAKFSADGRALVGEDSNNNLISFSTVDGHLLGTFGSPTETSTRPCYDISPDATFVLICDSPTDERGVENLKIWNIRTGRVSTVPLSPQCFEAARSSLSDGPTPITADFLGDAMYFEVNCTHYSEVRDVAGTLRIKGDQTKKFVLANDIALLAVQKTRSGPVDNKNADDTSDDEEIHGRPFAALPGFHFEDDQPEIAKFSREDEVIMLDLVSGREMRKLSGVLADATCMKFTPDHKYLVIGGRSFVQIWTTDTGELAHTLVTDVGDIQDIRFNRSGRLLFVLGEKGGGLWDTLRGQILSTPYSEGELSWGDFTTDGRYFVALATPGVEAVSDPVSSTSRVDQITEAVATDSRATTEVRKVQALSGKEITSRETPDDTIVNITPVLTSREQESVIDFEVTPGPDSSALDLRVWEIAPEERGAEQLKSYLHAVVPQELIDVATHLD